MKKVLFFTCILVLSVNLTSAQIAYGSIKLYNADSNSEILTISNGATYNLNTVGANLTIVAEPPTSVGSVRFETSIGEPRTEGGAPYAFKGDFEDTSGGRDFRPWTTLPNYLGMPITFTVSYYSAGGAVGTPLGEDIFTVTFINGQSPPTSPKINLTGLPVSQSSTAFGGVAEVAIDGNFDNFTHTVRETGPWWRIDLGEIYDIDRIVISNRGNCCQERLIGFQVYVGNIDSTDPNDYGASQITLNGDLSQDYPGLNGQGRFLLVHNSVNQVLSLGEIEIYGALVVGPTTIPVTGVTVNPASNTLDIGDTVSIMETIAPSNATNKNVIWSSSDTGVATVSAAGLVTALASGTTVIRATSSANNNFFAESLITVNSVQQGGPSGDKLDLTGLSVSQSSTAFGGVAEVAIDGNFDNFTHTVRETGPWWRIDLGEIYDIDRIVISNRGNCCQERLIGFQVYVGNIDSTDPNDYGASQITLNGDLSQDYPGLNGQGRFLLVHNSVNQVLSLGEIEIYGTVANGNTGGGTSVWSEVNSVASYTGKVAVGTANVPSDYQMAIDGKLITEEVRVELSGTWPDYVFKDGYQLPTLKEVQQHIKEKGHLPNIPSAKEVEENGIQLGEMDKLLLEKIEELTLYILEQQQQIEALKTKINKE